MVVKIGHETVLKEFICNSSDEEIRFLGMRLVDRFQDDLAEVLEHVGKSSARNTSIDALFRTAESAYDVYDYCDSLKKVCLNEAERRNVSLARGR